MLESWRLHGKLQTSQDATKEEISSITEVLVERDGQDELQTIERQNMERKIENARIVSTFLGINSDHGIFTCVLHLDYGSSRQGFGNYDLEYPDYGIEFLKDILNVVEVDSWEKLEGKIIRVDHDYGKVYGIGNVLKDNWFYPQGKEVTG